MELTEKQIGAMAKHYEVEYGRMESIIKGIMEHPYLRANELRELSEIGMPIYGMIESRLLAETRHETVNISTLYDLVECKFASSYFILETLHYAADIMVDMENLKELKF